MAATVKERAISEEVLNVLGFMKFEGNKAFINTDEGPLNRKLYMKVDEVLKALGGKWTTKVKAHVFSEDAQPLVEAAVLTGSYAKAGDMGWFPTPEPIVKKLIELADLKNGMAVLEPSAGEGAIAYPVEAIVGPKVTVIELDPKRKEKLADHFHTITGNFLEWPVNSIYDRVVMNPPFAPAQADIDHVMHAFNFLKPGGRLVSVMASSVKFRDNKKAVDFRNFIEENDGEIIDLPEGSFKISGTGVNTVIVVLNKNGN